MTPRTSSKEAQNAQQKAIDNLNARWDFGIPRPEESGSRDEDTPQASKLAIKCSNAIRYLCFRAPDLELAIELFEQEAKLKLPESPLKENEFQGMRGGRSIRTGSVEQRQATNRRALESKQRDEFAALLLRHLKDRADEVRIREKSFQADTGTETPSRHSEAAIKYPVLRDITPDPETRASKRSISDVREVCHSPSPVKKRLPPITPYLEKKQTHTIGRSNDLPSTSNLTTSFNTNVSEATEVFSQPPTKEQPVSFTTTPPNDSPKNESPDYFPSQLAQEFFKDPNFQDAFGGLERSIGVNSTEPNRIAILSQASTLSSNTSVNPNTEASNNISAAAKRYYRNALHHESPFQVFDTITVSEWRQKQAGSQEDGVRSITQSGSLEWRLVKKINECPFIFKPDPLRLELSCRLHRRFGSDRFMIVYLPSITCTRLPKTSSLNGDVIKEALAIWLSRDSHYFLKRKWKAFYLEMEKSTKVVGALRRYKVHFFAESGEGIDDKIPIRKLLQWHIPIRDNIGSTECKLFQRLSLGLSKTIATVALEQPEFARTECNEPIMNDGCARMSESLAREICAVLGLTTVPAVFQGRIAGAKGVWMVERDDRCKFVSERGFYIEISDDSQLKIKPHPSLLAHADLAKRTFEVLDYSRSPRSADLNLHFITILADRGVPRSTLKRHLLRDSAAIFQDLSEAWDDPILLRAWISTADAVTRNRGIEMTGSWPARFTEQAILLLESGFALRKCGVLVTGIRRILQDSLSRYVEAFRIKVPLSTTVFCIADPYGVLAEDEVHLGFSIVWEDEQTGFRDNILDDLDVLVARSPAFLPSDVQKRKAKWNFELRHFRDVIIFPIKGKTPLASLLSGGDYDGDKVWVCWDQSLVKPFQNAMPPDDAPSSTECGIKNMSSPLSYMFQDGKIDVISKREVKNFLQKCLSFNLQDSFLGHVATEFRKVTYDQGTISSPEAIKLATMAGYLVDAAKAGSFLPEAKWRSILAEVSPKELPKPAHRDPDAITRKAKKSDVLDYLKFFVAEPEKDRLLESCHQQWKHVSFSPPIDSDLTKLWEETCARNAKEVKEDKALKRLIDQLGSEINEAHMQWQTITQSSSVASSFSTSPITSPSKNSPKKYRNTSNNFSTEQSPSFSSQINALYTHIQTNIIPPKDICHHPLYDRYLSGLAENVPTHLTHWALLRASCIYNLFPRGMFAWYVAGAELCELKRRATVCRGNASLRTQLEPFYLYSKFDGKAARKTQNSRKTTSRSSLTTTITAAVAMVDHSVAEEDDAIMSGLWTAAPATIAGTADADADESIALKAEMEFYPPGE